MTYCGYFCDVLRESQKKNNIIKSAYHRPESSEYYEENFSQLRIKNYTCSTRLWLSYYIIICDNKYTFRKQMPQDLAVLLAFSIETVDRLDKVAWNEHMAVEWHGVNF